MPPKKYISEKQFNAIRHLTVALGWTHESVDYRCIDKFGVRTLDLSSTQASIIIEELSEIYNRSKGPSL